jgi:hypothetical protein
MRTPPSSEKPSIATRAEPAAADRFRARAEAALARELPAELRDLALEIGLEAADREWAQSCCVQLARHHDAGVRANAILAFGHLARRFGHLDPGRIRRLVSVALFDPSPIVRESARGAVLDLRTFLRWDFEDAP